MKKRISREMVGISVLSIVISIILVAAVFYRLFQEQVIEDLKTDARILQSVAEMTQDRLDYLKKVEEKEKDVRITLINQEGSVLYDTSADREDMDNHHGRPEIQDAMENGEGWAIRRSDTMKENTYYYAVLLKNGDILRLSKISHSLWSIYSSVIPAVLAAIVFLLLICFGLSHYLTKSIVNPIEEMGENMDRLEGVTIYEELRPFVETIKKQHESIIRNANMRQEFTANVSHELKTPLTAISGYSELIETGMATDEDIPHFAASIHKSANRLLTLINDIIRLSELDVSKETEMEYLDLYRLAETSVEMLQVSAGNRNVTLSLEGSSCMVKANKQMMEELLYNLCDNAVRYNNRGGHVDVKVGTEEGRPMLEVKDTGIGISKEHQERIFERFYRVDKSRSKSTGGTGLGLAIVKHIIVKHGAELKLESEIGKGTDMKVLFPACDDR